MRKSEKKEEWEEWINEEEEKCIQKSISFIIHFLLFPHNLWEKSVLNGSIWFGFLNVLWKRMDEREALFHIERMRKKNRERERENERMNATTERERDEMGEKEDDEEGRESRGSSSS